MMSINAKFHTADASSNVLICQYLFMEPIIEFDTQFGNRLDEDRPES
jgi:hypothetical protein